MKNISKKSTRYCEVGFITIVLLLTTCSVVGGSQNNYETFTKTYSFPSPQIHQVTRNGQVYDRIIMQDAEGAWGTGEPNLPTYGVSLLLPQGTRVADLSIQLGEKVLLGSGFLVEPVQEPVKVSELTPTVTRTTPDASIYSSDEVFPTTMYSVVGTYRFRGYDLLMLLLYPVQYIPSSGTLFYYEDMEITISTVPTSAMSPLFRGLENDEIDVAQKIDNLEMLSSYSSLPPAPLSDTYDLLILTTDALEENFIPLKEAHDTQGLITEIKTLNDISPLPGSVTPEDIREFIRDEYITNGIEYVLIGGDTDVVVAKELWVEAWSGGDADEMPSDLYYACLDGTYNYDEDEKWGETTDGENGDDVDLIGDVYVGRACVGNAAEANNFVTKTIAYMNTGGYSNGDVLMVGEYLWGPPEYEPTFGDEHMDELINGSNHNMYTTVGIPADTYSISKLYDHDWPGFDINNPWSTGWPTEEIITRINNGVRIINHLGHSGTGYNMRMVNDDVNDLTNTVLPFIYSQGCYAGAFDDGDCIAEYFSIKTTHAAFAAIMCARFGWGTPGSTDGPNQRFHRQFWDAVFSENITALGKANQDSKDDNIQRIGRSCMRWCYYEMNLFGDPAVTFFPVSNTPPTTPDRPTGTERGRIKQNYTFTTIATDSDGDKLYYQWSFGDGTFSNWAGPYNSDEEVSTSHEWEKRGTYEVKVKVRDEHWSESDWSEPFAVKMPFSYHFPFIEWILAFLEHSFPRLYSLIIES